MEKKVDYKEMWESLFHTDDTKTTWCRKCGKAWVHQEASPGDFMFTDIDGAMSEEWGAGIVKEGEKEINFHICSCGFPLSIDIHFEERWETWMSDDIDKR